MCMISKEIKKVAGTKIFVGVNNDKTKQMTVYANTVDNSSRNNAMVLPVPFPNSVVFHNLEKYQDFFTDCDDSFVNMTRSLDSRKFLNMSYEGSEKLDVYDVGSYKVSLAMCLDDLQRVDTKVFELSKGLDSMLNTHYSNPIFGFIICKLADGNEKYHPFAYSHNIASEKVFIPTRHYHDENINSFYGNYDMFGKQAYTEKNINDSPMFNSWAHVLNPNSNFSNKVRNSSHDQNTNVADDWEHEIYLYNVDLNSNSQVKKMNSCKKSWSGDAKINLKKIDFPLDGDCRVFTKLEIEGKKDNIDIVLSAC